MPRIRIKINPENINNDQKTQSELDKDRYSAMNREMYAICEKLSSKWENDTVEKGLSVISDLEKYLKNYDRILYSSISSYIFGLYGDDISSDDCDEKIGNMQTNILSVSVYAYDDKFQTDISTKTGDEQERLRKIPVISVKLLDHINLACQQCNSLKQTDEEYKRKFNKSIEPIKSKLTKEMNAQLLTLIGIFTALSFLLFGGISSLDNIFSHVNNVSILKLIIIGCIWGISLVNLIFVFLFCVAKMTKLSFASTENDKATIFQKYPIFWWTNYIIISILSVVSILFYMNKNNMFKWVDNVCNGIPGIVCFVSFSMLFWVIVGIGRVLKKVCSNKDDE